MALHKYNEESDEKSHQGKGKLNDLKKGHETFPPRHLPCDGSLEEITVHDNMHRGVEGQPDEMQALLGVHPSPCHDKNSGVVIHVQHEVRRRLSPRQLKRRIQQLVILAEIINVAPVVKRSARRRSAVDALAEQERRPRARSLRRNPPRALDRDAPQHRGAARDEDDVVSELGGLEVRSEPRAPLQTGRLRFLVRVFVVAVDVDVDVIFLLPGDR
mmetsp:Transcript_39142/g.79795  ORF Transcript_39142/g.79795 Transcript_39142/m.79795 type:complete len:215 (-) Transcript_39142:232-876(-)